MAGRERMTRAHQTRGNYCTPNIKNQDIGDQGAFLSYFGREATCGTKGIHECLECPSDVNAVRPALDFLANLHFRDFCPEPGLRMYPEFFVLTCFDYRVAVV